VLHDLKSTNGTLVNDQKVSRHILSEGDVIRIGETSLQFRLESRRD
jgi:pSer/pThr/pTyr-binding forkhead associated (FHA) protein